MMGAASVGKKQWQAAEWGKGLNKILNFISSLDPY
jgi:hypothetical protein